ncbi:DUF2846 domain-containing protein [Candidatus Desantisbacteria bacterium]|nr:DUF2846 domain-containing protein [Candidatus Desantisbacteria bacterium]
MSKIIRYILFSFIILSLIGCSRQFDYIINENPVHPQILKDKALIYVLRPSFVGFMVPFKVYLDDKPIGLTKGKTYFYFYTSPGKHIMKTTSGNTTELELDAAAGSKYYVKQTTILDKITPGNKTVFISEEEGEKLIKTTKMLQFIWKCH